jgi:hypothetical protein
MIVTSQAVEAYKNAPESKLHKIKQDIFNFATKHNV